MKDRILKIRKDNKLTQDAFAERLNLSKNFVWMLEKGDRAPSDRTILDICREFNINEEWLRSGKEPMKKILNPDDRYSHNLAKLTNIDDETIMNWVNTIAETNPAMLKEIEQFMKKLLGIDG